MNFASFEFALVIWEWYDLMMDYAYIADRGK